MKFLKDIIILNVCRALNQNWYINEGARIMTMCFHKTATVTLTLFLESSNSKLIRTLFKINHTKYLCEVKSKSVHK